KLCITSLLVQRDWDLVVPLLRVLKTRRLKVDTPRKEFLELYAAQCYEQMRAMLRTELGAEASIVMKRLSLFDSSLRELRAGRLPARGLLHILEPRIHWLIDLVLVDFVAYCDHGELKLSPGLSTADLPTLMSEAGLESLVTSHSKYLKKIALSDDADNPLAGGTTKHTSFEETLDDSIRLIGESTGRFVPVDIVADRVWYLALASGNAVSRSSIIPMLQNLGYPLFRSRGPSLGYLELRDKS
ncbi:MAG TPA: hypothetical protein VLX56_07100, partial [Nitrososphaerales archaeon]|nr:hypothetical protein [Nitrososphaerales archaeon]